MAKKAGATSKKSAKKMTAEGMIISKSRTKSAARRCNVSSDFYGALDKKVRDIIREAEQRALDNKRKTLRPYDI